MGRISQRFEELRASGGNRGKALIPFVTAGDPDLGFTKDLIFRLEEMGADLLELGVPFSDPMADGPTIQRSSFRSLKAGISLRAVLRFVEEIRKDVRLPLVLMTYYNPIFAMGEGKFVDEGVRAGVDGVIVPDLPFEEAGSLTELTEGKPLDLISMPAPTSTPRRRAMYCANARGFIYYVAQLGVTGARERLAEDLKDGLDAIRALTQVPVAAGFGIKTPEQAHQVSQYCDGVIVGSALIDTIDSQTDREAKLRAAGEFVQSIKKAIG
ncbi:MAG: tryptophan synthase subunit alpha [Nitrospinota bacterium]